VEPGLNIVMPFAAWMPRFATIIGGQSLILRKLRCEKANNMTPWMSSMVLLSGSVNVTLARSSGTESTESIGQFP
jgi:hypothetical protein